MSRAVLILLVFACKQQQAGSANPCAQYVGGICPSTYTENNEELGKQTEEDNKSKTDQDEEQKEKDDKGKTGKQTEEEEEEDKIDEEEEVPEEVELSALQVHTYLVREQLSMPAGKKLPHDEQGYVVGFYLSEWSRLTDKVRRQIVSTLVIDYGHLTWDIDNTARIALPVKLLFSAEGKQQCWQAVLDANAFNMPLQASDFMSASKNNRTSLRNLYAVQGRMTAMKHSTGGCK